MKWKVLRVKTVTADRCGELTKQDRVYSFSRRNSVRGFVRRPHFVRGWSAERRSIHSRLAAWTCLARHVRHPALHRGVFNPGPRFYSGLSAFAGRRFLSQLLAGGLLDRRAEPPDSRFRACEARQRAPRPAPRSERLRRRPREQDAVTLTPSRRSWKRRLKLLGSFRN
jgi:hypothetical protein